MAEHLASIFGTEKDRVNCPFYFKIGACRHGDRCSRLHNRPTISPTLVLSNMYLRPDMITPGIDAQGNPIDPNKMQEHFEDFYEDIYEELSKFGEIESLNVCDNLADHMIGNVYVQFREEDQAAAALRALQGRFYSGRQMIVDFSPVTDFREATCRQFEENCCNRGGYCNFMHVKQIGKEMRRRLHRGGRSRGRSRSPGPYRRKEGQERDNRERDRNRYRERGDRGDRDRDRGRERGGDRRERNSMRESSEERRAKIEMWNREREEKSGAGEKRDERDERNREREEKSGAGEKRDERDERNREREENAGAQEKRDEWNRDREEKAGAEEKRDEWNRDREEKAGAEEKRDE